MKKIAIAFLALIALALLVAAIAASQLDLAPYKGQIATAVKEKAGYDVKIDGDLKLSILPLPHVTVSGANLYNGQDRLVAVKNIDVRVALLPLLSKRVEVESLTLQGPEITLATDATGKGNWVTDTLQQQQDAAPAASDETKTAAAPPAITIKHIEIEDGTFTYRDGVTGVVRNIAVPSLKARADTLQGPFAVDGYLMVNQLPVSIKGQSGRLTDGSKPSPIQVELDISNGGAHVEYDGVWQNKPALKLDGDLALAADNPRAVLTELMGKDANLPEILDQALGLNGRVTLTDTAAELKDAQVKALGLEWQGQLAARGFGKDAVQQEFAVDLKSGDKPDGTGLKRLLAGSDIKVMASVADKNVKISRADITTADTAFNVTGAYTMPQDAAGKPTLVLNGAVDRLNVDSLMGAAPAEMKAKKVASDVKQATQEAATGKTAAVTGFTLPMNVQADLTVAKLVVKGKEIDNLALKVAGQGSKMTITNLAFTTLADTKVAAQGVIGNTQTLSGLDIDVTGSTGSVETLMQSFGQKTDQLPAKIGAAKLKAAITGSLDKLGFDGAVSALDAQVGAKGVAVGLPGAPALSDMRFSLKHPNLVKAVQIVKPDFSGDAYLQQPVDVTAAFTMQDKVIDIQSLSGKLGPLPIDKAVVKVDQSGALPVVSGSVALGDFVLPGGTKAKTASSAGGKGGASAPAATSGKSRWSSEKMDLAFLRSARVSLDATARSITQGQWTLSNPVTKVEMADGALTIPSLTAGLFGGKVDLSGKLAQDTTGVISTNWKGSAAGVNGKSLMSALTAKPSNTLEGTIDTFQFDLATGGVSQAALVGGLDGKLYVKGSNIVINGIDIPKLVSAFSNDFNAAVAITSLLNSSLQSGSTRFDILEATMPVADGVVTMSPTYLDSAQARMDVTGTVSLPAWYMNLKADVLVKEPADDQPTFNMLFKGPIDQPGKSIGQAALEHQLQKRLGKKVNKLLENSEVGQKLEKMGLGGILGGQQQGATTQQPTTPTTGTTGGTTGTAPPPQQQELTPEQQRAKAAEQLLKSLF